MRARPVARDTELTMAELLHTGERGRSGVWECLSGCDKVQWKGRERWKEAEKDEERCTQVGEDMREERIATEARCTVVVPADGGVGVSGWE